MSESIISSKKSLLHLSLAVIIVIILSYTGFDYYYNKSIMEKDTRICFEYISSFFVNNKMNLKGSIFILNSMKDNITSICEFRIIICFISAFFVFIRAKSSRLFLAYDVLLFIVTTPWLYKYKYILKLAIKLIVFFVNYYLN